jgi:hypothetical protein
MDVSEPANPLEAGVCNDQRLSMALAVSGKYAYGLDSQRLSIFDVSLPQSPTRVAKLDLPCPDPGSGVYDFWGVTIRAPYAYVSGMNWNPQQALLWIIDVSDPFAPRLVSSLICAYKAQCIGASALSGDYLYLGVGDFSQGENDCRSGLRVIDVRDPTKPKEVYIGISSIPGFGINVVIRENYAYLTGDKLRIFDLSNPVFPGLLATYALYSEGIALSGDFAYLNSDKLWVVDISDLNNPTGSFFRGEYGKGVAVSGNLAFVPGSLSVLKNTLAPDASLTSPSGSSTLLGSVLIEAQADHASGIDRVEFYIEDTWKASDTSAPYSYTWDTTSAEDGLHTMRARAYNANGKSSDAEREVYTRLVYAPLTFAGERVLNGWMSPFDILFWQAHPDNVNIIKYRLFRVEEGKRILLAELDADTFQYRNMRVVRGNPFTTYALIAVNDVNRESDPVSVTVR